MSRLESQRRMDTGRRRTACLKDSLPEVYSCVRQTRQRRATKERYLASPCNSISDVLSSLHAFKASKTQIRRQVLPHLSARASRPLPDSTYVCRIGEKNSNGCLHMTGHDVQSLTFSPVSPVHEAVIAIHISTLRRLTDGRDDNTGMQATAISYKVTPCTRVGGFLRQTIRRSSYPSGQAFDYTETQTLCCCFAQNVGRRRHFKKAHSQMLFAKIR